jgi:phosphatidylglycerol:prolipoprotein diacylglycerol transferase
MLPILFTIRLGSLSLPLHTYGLLLALAFLAGVVLAQREARRRGLDAEAVGDLTFWLLVAGIAGSMVFYVLLNRDEFTGPNFWADPPFQRWPRVLVVWKIGLVFYGGFIAAALTTFFYMRARKMPFLPYADVLVPSVAFGHFLGRLGCFSAGCCWGSRASDGVPWAVRFPSGSSVFDTFAGAPDRYAPAAFLAPDHLHTVGLHPVQLYEAFGELALFLVLVFLVRPRKRFHGQVFATWLVAYALLRGVLELFRGDLARSLTDGLNSGQWTSVVILAAGLAVWFLSPRPRAEAAPATV